MGRFLLLGLALWAAMMIIRHLYRQRQAARQRVRQGVKSVDSVQCRYCGLHLPRADAVRQGDAYFCSQEHRDADNRRKHPSS